MYFDFTTAFVFLIVGVLFLVIALVLSRLLQPRHPTAVKLSTYECGELPVGQSWIQFNNRFYVIALVFLIFDVEIAFLFPWAVVFKKLGWFAFVEALIFIGILLVGLAYVWRKGDSNGTSRKPANMRVSRLRNFIKKHRRRLPQKLLKRRWWVRRRSLRQKPTAITSRRRRQPAWPIWILT